MTDPLREIETAVERGQVPGAVLVVADEDQPAEVAAVGQRDLEMGLSMEADTIFRIASMTKPIVSVGILMLTEADSLDLDDPVARYIPEFAEPVIFTGVDDGQVVLVPVERRMTVAHLLTHTAGIGYSAPDPILAGVYDNFGDEQYDLDEFMRRVSAHPLANQPGDAFVYGYAHDVLGRVIEVVADEPLDEYLRTRVFGPLGMVDTGFQVPASHVMRVAARYDLVDGALSRVLRPDRAAERPSIFYGGGGLYSTGPDYLRFCRMLLEQGALEGARLLQPGAVEQMTSNQLPFNSPSLNGTGYGLGVGVILADAPPPPGRNRGMYGWSGYWGTEFWVDPRTRSIGIYLEQTHPASSTGTDVLRGIAGAWSHLDGSRA